MILSHRTTKPRKSWIICQADRNPGGRCFSFHGIGNDLMNSLSKWCTCCTYTVELWFCCWLSLGSLCRRHARSSTLDFMEIGAVECEWRYHSMPLTFLLYFLVFLSSLLSSCFSNDYQNYFHNLLLNFCLQHYAKNKLLFTDCILKGYSLLSGV